MKTLQVVDKRQRRNKFANLIESGEHNHLDTTEPSSKIIRSFKSEVDEIVSIDDAKETTKVYSGLEEQTHSDIISPQLSGKKGLKIENIDPQQALRKLANKSPLGKGKKG